MTTPRSSKHTRQALGNFGKANDEARDRYLGELANRTRAARILNPNEVAGDYDASRLLATTLGGYERAITADDLKVFRQNVQMLGKRFRGGITAKTVIDMSMRIDRDRANEEIRTALPIQALGSRVHFITNAGPNSNVTRHHVHLEFLNLSAAVSSPARAADMAKLVTSGALKFDCDCGRHTFWFRYIATVGKFNAGRDETGFPKIRNPKLVGVACKHVLRVMNQLSAPQIRKYVADMIERGRQSLDRPLVVLTKKQAQDLAAEQIRQQAWKRSAIESADEKRARVAVERQAKVARGVAPRQVAKMADDARQIARAKQEFVKSALMLSKSGVLRRSDLEKLLARMKD